MRSLNVLPLLLALVGASATACKGEPSRAEDDPPLNRPHPNADFYGMMRRVHHMFTPFKSEPDLRAASDRVVQGQMADVVDGRTFYAPTGQLGAQHTFLMKIDVKVTLKGTNEQTVFVEWLRPSYMTIEELRGKMPGEELRFYLRNYVHASRITVFNSDRGLPSPNTPIYHLTNPQGMLVATTQGLAQPLTEEPMSILKTVAW